MLHGTAQPLAKNIDPDVLDLASSCVASELGTLKDLQPDLANTVINCYYRAFNYWKTRNPNVSTQALRKPQSAMELYREFSRDSAEALAGVKFIASHIHAIRGMEPKTDDLRMIREMMVQVTLDTFKYHIHDATKKNAIWRAVERKFKKPSEIEGLHGAARPLIAAHVAKMKDGKNEALAQAMALLNSTSIDAARKAVQAATDDQRKAWWSKIRIAEGMRLKKYSYLAMH